MLIKFKRWVGIAPKLDGNNNFYEIFDELFYNTYYFQLKDEKDKLTIGGKLILNGEKVNDSANTWLKLFCLRQWSLKENSDIKYGKYVIPADLGGLDDELIDAIRILEYMEGRELMMVIEKSKLFIKSYFWRNRGRRKRRKKRRNRRRKKRNRRRNKSRKKRTINKTDNGTVKKGEKLNEYIIDLLTNEKLFIYLFIIYIYI